MKTFLKQAVVCTTLWVATSTVSQAASYTVDLSHSFIKFETNHLGFSKLSGRFNKFDGKLIYDPDAGVADQHITINIDMASVDTNWADRDKHLRGDDFFNVDEFKTATFESTGYDGDANGGMLAGKLTFLGMSKDVQFPIEKIGEGEDPWGGYRVGFEGKYTLTRKDFGMEYNLGPKAEIVEITLQIEAIRDE